MYIKWYKCILCTNFFKSLKCKFGIELLKAWINLHKLTFALDEKPFFNQHLYESNISYINNIYCRGWYFFSNDLPDVEVFVFYMHS